MKTGTYTLVAMIGLGLELAGARPVAAQLCCAGIHQVSPNCVYCRLGPENAGECSAAYNSQACGCSWQVYFPETNLGFGCTPVGNCEYTLDWAPCIYDAEVRNGTPTCSPWEPKTTVRKGVINARVLKAGPNLLGPGVFGVSPAGN